MWVQRWQKNTTQGFEREGREWVVAVLTRGYETLGLYSKLIDRTKAIDSKVAGDFDHVIFHEGNIPQSHQDYIREQCKSPHRIIFKNIQYVFESICPRTDGVLCPETSLSKHAGPGYKAMCKFWTGCFATELSEYKFCLRIDEDCIVIGSSSVDTMTTESARAVMMSPCMEYEEEQQVTRGLPSFFRELDSTFPSTWLSPYTNVVVFNLQWVRSAEIKSITDGILATRCIDTNRWGDMPIWGAIMALKKVSNEPVDMKYYHGSHDAEVG